MNSKEITQHVDDAIAQRKTWRIKVMRRTNYTTHPIMFEVAPHGNPAITEMTFGVYACEDAFGIRNFDYCVNKSYDTKKQFINALKRALRHEQ